MSKTPWVVLDANKQVMRCNRCGHTEPLSMIEGKRMDFAAAIMNGFVDCHRECEELP